MPNAAGQLALTLINLGSGNLINLELSALEADNRGKVVSSPRVITGDNQKAHIEQGTEIPYVTPGSANSPATVAFKKAVLRLDVTPQITPDNRIIMTVEVRKDTVGQFVQLGGGFQVPSIDTENVITQISVNNGDTAVIGGIYEETIRNDVDKVPWLGDIPFLGYLFKTDGDSEREDRAPDLPHAARRQGTRSTIRAVSDADLASSGARSAGPPPVNPLQCPGAAAPGQFVSGRAAWARASPRSAASSRAACTSAFVDADAELEQRLGVSIPTIFEIEGEAGFRDREEAVLAELTALAEHRARDGRRRRASGPANRERLKENGTVIYLHAEPATLCERIRHSRQPAAAQTADPLARLAELYAAARPALSRGRRPRRRVRSRRGHALRRAQLEAGWTRRRARDRRMRTLDVALRRAQLSDPRSAAALLAARRRARSADVGAPRRDRRHQRRPSRAHWLAPLRAEPGRGGRRAATSIVVPDGEAHKSLADAARRRSRACSSCAPSAGRCWSRWAAAWSATSPASPRRSTSAACRSSRCRRRCSRRSIRRSAARPASTIRSART